ncbi:aldolase/citrate lyase family protein [Geomonas subterranea]|uniref:aldolase/citrate lyase family protein n=1 Tax=Geomonas subterranea TaxID=2847989 RepID=UPI001CD47D81|nr:aldolase/citrate lyase family protein [Geomonas fuzhouensis]
MDFIYITNDSFRAGAAQAAGVQKIMVDLEINGKEARQGHLNSVISRHSFEDVTKIRKVLNSSKLMVRVNPLHNDTAGEISRCIDLGADILMLPMFNDPVEVDKFLRLVGGRVETCLLLETGQALARVNEIVKVDGIQNIHIGLNDLHLSLKLDFMFELLSCGIVEYLASSIRTHNIKFGFGGIARIGQGALGSDLILSEHHRLGSSQVILSRDFNLVYEGVSPEVGGGRFCEEVESLKRYIHALTSYTADQLLSNSLELKGAVRRLVSSRYL